MNLAQIENGTVVNIIVVDPDSVPEWALGWPVADGIGIGWTVTDDGFSPPPGPTPEELRALMPKLAKWRVHAAINLVPGLREKIDAEIDAMPEPGRTINKSKLDNVIEYDRLDPLFDLIGTSATIGFSPEDIDVMWMQAAEF